MVDLLVRVKDATLARNMFDSLSMNVLYSSYVIGNVCVVVVLVCDDSLSVQVIAIDLGYDRLVQEYVVIIFSNKCSNVTVD